MKDVGLLPQRAARHDVVANLQYFWVPETPAS